ncbi:M56 family metallopeptidase [Streptomyces sp. MST-110588]|uniref:M56 family metallopeptidase n=1 Tax=Streptomyces sp. MST-110588 TaxID=2833628 RepID=UPI001F5CD2A0|nr:M56 family metallopeptidase [Streptomyces sp. MST-110588]UNO41104.1 M56 family metallopeptidase [Streptomyces sp. MST-110588]
MGVFVFLPLVLPLTALPIARLAGQHLHPRGTTRLLTVLAAVLAVCSTLCLGLLVVVGTAQLPGNPLPDSWSDPEVRAAVPYVETAGTAGIVALTAALVTCAGELRRHYRVRARTHRALDVLPHRSDVAVLPDDAPYAYAVPGRPGRIAVSRGMLRTLDADERRALFAHERAHLTGRHHRFLLTVRLAGCLNPLLLPLRSAVAFSTERWADEEAARAVGDRRLTARAVGKAALVSRPAVTPELAHFAAPGPGPVPRRVAALLAPVPPARSWPPALTPAGFAALVAAAGTAASALSSLNAAVALFLVLKTATPL